jgi:hypothetical protein
MEMGIGPAHRRLNALVEFVERAVFDLNPTPDRGIGIEKNDFELVEPLGYWNGTDALRIFDGLGRGFNDVPKGVPLHAVIGMANGFMSLLLDGLEFVVSEGKRALVRRIEQ